MIIQPSPTGPRSPIRRAMRLGGLVAAPLLLVAAVGVGLTGPKPEPPTPAPSVAPPATPVVAASPAPAATPAIPADTDATSAGIAPGSFAGLNTVTPSRAVALRAEGHAGPLVVGGELKLSEPDEACDGGALGPLGPWCARTGILAERAWAVTGADFDPLSAHLHVTLPLGVRAPDSLARMAVATAGPPLPVVVVGRFTGNRCDPGDLAWCEEPFVVDRVVWADGTRTALTPLAEDRLASVRRPPNPLQLAVADRQTPLLAVLAWPATVAGLDPATADDLAGLEPSEPLWYLRVLEGEGQSPSSHGGTPAVRWYLLDERRFDVLAAGASGTTADPASVPPSRTADRALPAVAADLGVRSVDDALAVAADRLARPIAVAGRLRQVMTDDACQRPRDPEGRWCARTAILVAGRGEAPTGPAMVVRVPPGVRLPASEGPGGVPADPVIVVGQLLPARAGCSAASGCAPELRAERIDPADDLGRDVRPVIDRSLGEDARTAAVTVRPVAEGLAAGASGTALRSTLLRRDRLALVDAVASAAVSAQLPSGRPLWYATAVQTVYGAHIFPPSDIVPRITWVVVDATTGALLASGER